MSINSQKSLNYFVYMLNSRYAISVTKTFLTCEDQHISLKNETLKFDASKQLMIYVHFWKQYIILWKGNLEM